MPPGKPSRVSSTLPIVFKQWKWMVNVAVCTCDEPRNPSSFLEKQMTATQSFVNDFIHGVYYLSMSIDRAISLDSRSNSLWFFITTTLNWLKILAPLSQPIRSQIKFWMVWWFAIVFWNWSEWLQSAIYWSRDTRLCGCRSTHHPTIRQILWRYWINSIKIYQQDWGGGIKEQFLYDSYIYKWREILLNEMDSWGLIMAIIV